ncbi:NlpC/P60 family protein [Serratia sp. UGAL515B_01]|uniref:NlpC/P60 family protein n=1 Tax=Serratia sp. UGAL515B_01 TaxID=2986763 RepID=UPI0029529F09|nr:NlpC/P60 family protein [Serratia sp. UGAL515B_01]WON76989.1 NlpC/P60 family protein [Serratia sp. UGAL515B_01]
MLKIVFSFVLALLFTFSVSAATLQNASNSSASLQELTSLNFGQGNTKQLKKILTHFVEWEGVRYKLGGNSQKGIDCSAYIQRIFKDEFSFILPRTTHEQIKLGTRVAINELDTGDLLFFKTSSRELHVGVYIGEGQFIHASTSTGVTISELDNTYWKERYKQARRINNANV